MPYQYVLFDYDGCLADTVSPWVQAIRVAAAEFGLVLGSMQIREQFGELVRVREHGLREDLVPLYRDRVKELARSGVITARLHEGAYELLHGLSGEEKELAVVSTNSLGLNKLLTGNGVRQFFRVVLAGNDVREKVTV